MSQSALLPAPKWIDFTPDSFWSPFNRPTAMKRRYPTEVKSLWRLKESHLSNKINRKNGDDDDNTQSASQSRGQGESLGRGVASDEMVIYKSGENKVFFASILRPLLRNGSGFCDGIVFFWVKTKCSWSENRF